MMADPLGYARRFGLRRAARLLLAVMVILCAVGWSEGGPGGEATLPPMRVIDVIQLIGLFALGMKTTSDWYRDRKNGRPNIDATRSDKDNELIEAFRDEIKYMRTSNHGLRDFIQATVTKVAVLETLVATSNARLDRIEHKLETIGEWLSRPGHQNREGI